MKRGRFVREDNNLSLLIISVLVILVLSLGVFMNSLIDSSTPTGYSIFSDLFSKITGQSSPSFGPSEGDISIQATCPSGGTCFYIRDGATGTSCSDWSSANACDTLPATLVRGAIYYIADGNYGSYTFDDANSGTQYITIKKATTNEHGTDTGWVSTYGDGQAQFGSLNFDSSNYVINGSTRNANNWTNGSSYGISIASSSATGTLIGIDIQANNLNVQNIKINNIYGYYSSCCFASDSNINHHFSARYGGGNFYIGNSFFENVSWGASILINGVDTMTIENNYFRNILGKELISSIGSSSNIIFRNNFIKNVGGTLAIGKKGTGLWEIYNNVFWSPDPAFLFTDGRIIGDWTNQGSTSSNLKVFGNTFYDISGSIAVDSGTGNEARNNLFIGFSPGFTNFASSNNLVSASSSSVLNANAGNFHLSAPTNAGATLATPFNTDLEGNARGSDGIWDIGAYEYVASGPDTMPPSIITFGPSGTVTSTFITLTVNTNEVATCRYSTTDIAYNSMNNTFSITGSTTHTQGLTGLTNGNYNYYVRCNDTSGNVMIASTSINFTVFVSGGGTSTCTGTCYYIRDGGTTPDTTGSNCGTNWNNACDSLPATLQRGATYYIANGTYPAYTFNTVESGSTKITVKKATLGDHGTDIGWQASYGTTQAVFSSYFNIERGYFEINGSYRNESNWFNGTSYGFKIQNTGNWQHIRIMDPSGIRSVSNVTVANAYIAAIVGSLPSGCNNHCTTTYGPCAINTNTESSVRNVGYLFSRVYVEGSNNPFFLRYLDKPILEYSASEKTTGSACWHGDTVNMYYGGNGVIRYNYFKDQYVSDGSTGVVVFSDSPGAQVYGNIFENVNVGNGVIVADWPNNNLKIHHNTFVDATPYSDRPVISFPTGGNTGTGNEAYNNLRYNTVQINFVGGAGSGANNSDETSSAFLNYNGGDLRLARATNVRGRSLASPYNLDMFGNLRGSDGFIDAGAYEYISGAVTVIDGSCSSTPNTCTSPSFAINITQNSSSYIWTCPGQNGGVNKSCSAIIPNAKFKLGDRIFVNASAFALWIRDAPAGNYLGDQLFNSLGTVISGPIDASLPDGPYRWWNIDFDSGIDGWTVEGWLEKSNQYHPADLNNNLAVSLNEFTNYSSYFKLSRSWPIAPSPPDANYYSRAYFLLKRGLAEQGAYSYNASASCPSCFIVR